MVGSPDLRMVAGGCSTSEKNIDEISQLHQHGGLWGARVIGLKSRTSFDPSGEGMGMDYETTMQNLESGTSSEPITPLSVELARTLTLATGLIIASEIMMPHVQLPVYARELPRGKFMPWNPSVNELGWNILEMARFARENGWSIGVKNGKTLGDIDLDRVTEVGFNGTTRLQKTWEGQASFGVMAPEVILIYRGVDVKGKGDYRNAPVHSVAALTKMSTENPMFYDPSHINGPKGADIIVKDTINAMKMVLPDGSPLYDGVLIEVGTSSTDTEQHISVDEYLRMIDELSKFRTLVEP